MLYLLVDRTYQKWPVFMEPIGNVSESENSRFAEVHKEVRKSVGTFFEMMRNKFNFLYPAISFGPNEESSILFDGIIILNN